MPGEFDIDVQDAANDGHFVIAEDGGFKVGGICCGAACEHCPCETPSHYTIVVSKIASCACTAEQNMGTESALGECYISATFCVTQDAVDPCLWTNFNVGTIIVYYYLTPDCSGAPNDIWQGTAIARLVRTAGNFALTIRADSIDGVGGDAYAFDGSGAVADCNVGFLLSDSSNCVHNFLSNYRFKLCEDGTASITPGC